MNLATSSVCVLCDQTDHDTNLLWNDLGIPAHTSCIKQANAVANKIERLQADTTAKYADVYIAQYNNKTMTAQEFNDAMANLVEVVA